MSEVLFPRTDVAGVSVSRMIIGTNWMLGWSHRSPAQDHQILRKFSDGEKAFPMLQTFLDRGVDTIMGPLQQERVMQEAVQYAQEKTGKKLILINTPIINVDDNEEARRQARATILRRAAGQQKQAHHRPSAGLSGYDPSGRHDPRPVCPYARIDHLF